ncbi:MAG: YqaA family protein [Planctomycetota bacterium]
MLKPVRKLYSWTERLAYKKGAGYYLLAISFIEASLFPLPPDLLLIPIAYFNNKKGIIYAFLTTVFSVLGGLFGYLIGVFLYHNIIPPHLIIGKIISQANFNKVVELYKTNVFLVIFTAALSPIPYKVFTIAGGYCNVNISVFTVASFVGRGLRFFSEGILFYAFGPAVKPYIDRNFEKLTLLAAALIVLFYLIIMKIF